MKNSRTNVPRKVLHKQMLNFKQWIRFIVNVEIDGVQAVRSPGSTLKPFVYAQAFDKGLLTPKSILADVPTDFNGYAPANFDQKFYGKVSVETALSYSLNIPAVKTLELVGQKEFVDVLKKAGFQTIQKKANHIDIL